MKERLNNAQPILIYQTEDGRAYCLEKIENNGKYNNEAACNSQYYELPSEFYLSVAWGHLVIKQHGTSNQVEILRGKNNLPELAIFNKPRTSRNYRVLLTPIEETEENKWTLRQLINGKKDL